MKNRTKYQLGAMLLICLFTCSAVVAQEITSNVSGSVLDQTEGVLAGATVKLISEGTQSVRTMVTDDHGSFVFNLIPPGVYSLEASLPGFKTYRRSGITLSVNQHVTVNLLLTIGELTESIVVSGDASMLEAKTHSMGKVIDNMKVEELPLLGRDYKSLGLLVPGSLPLGRFSGYDRGTIQSSHGFFVNGLRSSFNNFLLDGGSNNNSNEGGGLITPNPETIKEFKILTNSYSAEFNGASTIVNVVTKSGTNLFHGSLFDFVRNDLFDARGYFESEKAPLRQNQFGGTFGGPIFKDKTFFFASYEGLITRDGVTRRITVPPAEWRVGDFSGYSKAIKDPETGANFPGNIIPEERFNPVAKNIMDRFYPLPNDASGFFTKQQSVATDGTKWLIRLDQQLTESNSLYGRYIYEKRERSDPNPLADDVIDQTNLYNQGVMVSDTHILTPEAVNEFRLSYLRRNTQDIIPPLPGSPEALGFNYQIFEPDFVGTPIHIISGIAGLGTQNAGQHKVDNTWQIYDVVAWNKGNHSIRFGGEYNSFQIRNKVTTRLTGTFRFNGGATKLAFADFLLGIPFRFDQTKLASDRPFWGKGVGFFVQDDWRLRSNLTLNLGMRYDIVFPPVDNNFGMMTTLWADEQSERFPDAPQGLLYSGDPQIPKGIIGTDANNWAPRVGLAWQATRKWVVRAGFGLYFDTKVFANYQTQLAIAPPFEIRRTIDYPNSYTDPLLGVVDPFSLPEGQRFSTPLATIRTLDRFNTTPYAQQWSMSLQYELAKDYLLEIGYVGTKGTKLMRANNLNDAIWAPGATTKNVNARRPYQDFREIMNFQASSNSTYNSLQLSLNKRFSNGFTFLSSYTWSKTLDDAIGANIAGDQNYPQNSWDLSGERALSSSHIPHRWVSNFIWRLPFFSESSGLVKQVFAGWQVNGIVSFRSGDFTTVLEPLDIALIGRTGQRTNLVGDPNDGPKTTDEWFNTGAFERLDPDVDGGKFGNASRNTVQRPGQQSWDFSLFKNFLLKEDWKLQVRGEFFNAFNHRNLGNPSTSVDSPNFGKITGAGSGRRIQLGLKLLF